MGFKLKFAKSLVRLTVVLGSVVLIYKWFQKNKIPLWCVACEEEGVFVKCTENTGVGSEGCARYLATVDALRKIKLQIPKIKGSFSKLQMQFMVPIEKINMSLEWIKGIQGSLDLSIPEIPSLKIPPLKDIDFKFDFSGIPVINPGKDIIEPAINGALVAINWVINGLRNILTDMTIDLNSSLDFFGIPRLNMPRLDLIPDVIIDTVIDLSFELRKLGLETIDVGALLKEGMDAVIYGLNVAMDAVVYAINFSIKKISDAFKAAGRAIQDAMSNIALDLKMQMETMNIFKDIIPEIKELTWHFSQLSIGDVVETWVLPQVQMLFPSAKIADIMLISLLVIIMGALIYAGRYVYSLTMPIRDIMTIASSVMSKGIDKVREAEVKLDKKLDCIQEAKAKAKEVRILTNKNNSLQKQLTKITRELESCRRPPTTTNSRPPGTSTLPSRTT